MKIESNRIFTHTFLSEEMSVGIDWHFEWCVFEKEIPKLKFESDGSFSIVMHSDKYDFTLFIRVIKETLHEFLSKYDNKRFMQKVTEIETVMPDMSIKIQFNRAFKRAKEVLGYIDQFADDKKIEVYPHAGYADIKLKEKEIENETLQTRF